MPRPADAAESLDPSSQRTRTLGVLFGGVLLGALDIAIVGPALPAIQQAFELSARQLSWVFTSYILFGLIGAPLLAALSDRHGRRTVFSVCLIVFGLGSTTVALAPAFAVLILGRAIQAFGAGGFLPVASAVIADTFPLERRGRALGLIGAVFGIAFVIGPVIGGLLLQWSWRWLFLVNIPLLLVLLVAARRILPDTVALRPLRFDWAGAAALAIALSAAAWSASQIETGIGWVGPFGPMALAGLALAAVALWLFWRLEHRADDPILHPELLRARQLRIVGALALATGLVEASMVFLPTLSVAAFGVSASTASFMLLPLVAALMLGSVVAGRLLDRIGPKPVIQAGMALTVLGLLLFALLPLATVSFYAAGLAVGLGLSSLLGAPLRFVTLQEAGVERRGASQGLLTLFLSSGRMFGAAMIGGIAAAGGPELGGYRRAMLVIAACCGLGLIASFWLRRRRDSAADRDSRGEPARGT